MASGRTAFSGDSVHGILRRVLAEEPPALETLDPALSPELGAIVRRALAKEPAERYGSAREMVQALAALRAPSGVRALPAAPKAPGAAFRPGPTALVLVGLVLTTIGIAWWYVRPSLAFHSRDMLLVASVDNRTNEEAFDLALRTALESDLQRSPYASVFDQGQVIETLRLMRKDPETPIDEELGRDLCRFAGVRALLVPRILAAGDAFELQAILVDPTTGRHVDQIRVTARGREDVLLHAIDELSTGVRERLGESLESITAADAPVAQTTTSSWEALQLFSVASAAVGQGRYQEASSMYQQALAKDPEFVSAKAAWSLVLIQNLDQRPRGVALLREARAHADGLPQWERLMLDAVCAEFVDRNLPAALEQYRMIARLYPNRMEPLNNAGQILRQLGRYDEAVAALEESARLSEAAPVPIRGLFWLNILRARPEEAERYARRLVELGPDIADYQHYLAWSLWAQGRLDEALDRVRRVVALEPRHAYGRANLAHLLLATGRAAEAEPIYRALVDESAGSARNALARGHLALALRSLGRTPEGREVVEPAVLGLRALAAPSPSQLADLAFLAAVEGEASVAEGAIARASAAHDLDGWGCFTLARARALAGDPAEAVALLDRAIRSGLWDRYFARIAPGFESVRERPDFLALLSTPPRAP
jgi:tetratricopeptide (TPR) repeat protein